MCAIDSLSGQVRKRALSHLRAHDQQEALTARLDLCQMLGRAEQSWKERMHTLLETGHLVFKNNVAIKELIVVCKVFTYWPRFSSFSNFMGDETFDGSVNHSDLIKHVGLVTLLQLVVSTASQLFPSTVVWLHFAGFLA